MATAYRWNQELPEQRLHPQKGPTAAPRSPSPSFTVMRGTRPRKSALVELCTVKKIDNSRLVLRMEPVRLRNHYKTVALGGIVALFFTFYVYQHFRCIDLSFRLEDLRAKQAQAQALNSEMKLEIATLRDPRRIDVIARRQLGLTQPSAIQLREYSGTDGAEVAAAQYGKSSQ